MLQTKQKPGNEMDEKTELFVSKTKAFLDWIRMTEELLMEVKTDTSDNQQLLLSKENTKVWVVEFYHSNTDPQTTVMTEHVVTYKHTLSTGML